MDIEDRINSLRELVKLERTNGNWNYSQYSLGMANGMILALSVITEEEPEFMSLPEVFLSDLPHPEGEPIVEP